MWCPKFNCTIYHEQYLQKELYSASVEGEHRLLLGACIAFSLKQGPRIFTSGLATPHLSQESESHISWFEKQNTSWKFSLPWIWELLMLSHGVRAQAQIRGVERALCKSRLVGPPIHPLFPLFHCSASSFLLSFRCFSCFPSEMGDPLLLSLYFVLFHQISSLIV